MKANVQYNDFQGTTAVDIGDDTSLKILLKEYGVDTDKYTAIGTSFFSNYNDFSVKIICIDNVRSTKEEPHIIEIDFEKRLSKDDYFNLFKRFHSVAVNDYYNQFEINRSITIEESKDEF